MKILVTGKGGQLASEFYEIKSDDTNWIFMSSNELDITNKNEILNYFNKHKIDFIINCAAYTAVDNAEDEINIAYDVNVNGVENLMTACKINNSKIIHFSTDYVFDGVSNEPYNELSITNPVTIYGKTKLEGENLLRKDVLVKSMIIRTSWVYSNYGKNFAKTIISLSKSNNKINIVSDQIGSPTYAKDLANAVINVITNKTYTWSNGDIFNYSNEGKCSWFEFACKIFINANVKVDLKPIKSDEYFTKAKRPKYSLLDKTKIKKTFNIEINHWESSLRKMIKKEI